MCSKVKMHTQANPEAVRHGQGGPGAPDLWNSSSKKSISLLVARGICQVFEERSSQSFSKRRVCILHKLHPKHMGHPTPSLEGSCFCWSFCLKYLSSLFPPPSSSFMSHPHVTSSTEPSLTFLLNPRPSYQSLFLWPVFSQVIASCLLSLQG